MKSTKNRSRFNIKSPLEAAFPKLNKILQSNEMQCERIDDILNDIVKKDCSIRPNELQTGNCNTTGSGRASKVDIVVLIDTSPSMSDEASQLSIAAQSAVDQALHNCPSDLRVTYLGIEGIWAGTLFNQTYRAYLSGLGISGSTLIGTTGDQEDGAAAMIDISEHFDWRTGAKRSIFYLGDEALEGGYPQDVNDINAATSAIAVANNRNVSIFTYLGTGNIAPVTKSEYQRVANQTGGQYHESPVSDFVGLFAGIICSGMGSDCQIVDKPKIIPCISIKWGDGEGDNIETDDCEVVCVTVCNPYSNVILENFTLNLFLFEKESQNVPLLPDGTPSVFLKPAYLIKYGDIPPCGDKQNANCITKENVLISRGAKEGKYSLVAVYCFKACFQYAASTRAMVFDLVKS